MLILFIFGVSGCTIDSKSTNPETYKIVANQTVLAGTIYQGPKDKHEKDNFDKVDHLFLGSAGYRSYKELMGKSVLYPKVIHADIPDYPTWALLLRLEAIVELVAVVDQDGNVKLLKVLNSTDERFNDSAIRSALKWRFTSGYIDGKPEKFYLVIPVKFHLRH